MTDCRRISSYLLDSYYGDLSAERQQEVDLHLENCPFCQEEFSEIRFTLDVLKRTRAEAPDAAVLERSWEGIRAGIFAGREGSAASRAWDLDLGWWVPRLAFSLLLIVSGVWIGWHLRPVSSPGDTSLQADLGPALSSAPPSDRLWRHLQRTEVVMLEIMNFQAADDDEGELSLELSQSLSEQLLQEGDAVRAELESSGDTDEELLALVGDLERILLQIAHLGNGPESREVIEALREAIREQALLLRIDMAEILERRKAKSQSEKTA